MSTNDLGHHCPDCTEAPPAHDKINTLIERLGCATISITHGTPVPYSYTVGLTERGQPELYVQGTTDPTVAASILYFVAANYPEPGDYLDGRRVSVGDHHARLDHMDDTSLLAVAVDRYGKDRVRAMKLVQEHT